MAARQPWERRPLRTSRLARQIALAAEQILVGAYGDTPMIDSVLNQVEMAAGLAIQRMQGSHPMLANGFDPETKVSMPARLEYNFPARTAQELIETQDQVPPPVRPPPAAPRGAPQRRVIVPGRAQPQETRQKPKSEAPWLR